MRNDLTMANEQVGLVESAMEPLQTSIGDRGQDMVLKVVLHSRSQEVILEPPRTTCACDPVHTVGVAHTRVKMLGDRFQA